MVYPWLLTSRLSQLELSLLNSAGGQLQLRTLFYLVLLPTGALGSVHGGGLAVTVMVNTWEMVK